MKTIARLFTFILFITAIVTQSKAVQNTRLFNAKEIVSSNYSSFCLDNNGCLWIGTQYGLLRFDGTNFDKYLHDEKSETSLSDNRISKILRDNNDRLWVATCEGLNLYDPGTDSFKRITLPNMDLYGYIFDMHQLSNGDIIFMVSGVGLYILDFSSGSPVAVKYMAHIENLTTLNSLGETKKGELIGGNHTGEIMKISPNGQGRTYKVADSYIKILLRDDEGNFFITTTNKAWRWDVKTDEFKPVHIPAELHPVMDCAALTSNGDILVGTIGCGVFRLEKGSMELKPYRELINPIVNLDIARISTIHEDTLGNLWLGSPHQGIVMAPKQEIPYNFISIARAQPGYSGGKSKVAVVPETEGFWIGLDDGRLIRVNEYGKLLSKHQLGGGVSSIFTSKSGKLYLGVDNHGLFELTPSSGELRQLINVDGNYLASAVTEDAYGNILLGIHGEGVMKVNPKTKVSEWIVDNEGNRTFRWISSLFCDSRGKIWIGMYGALSQYDPATGKYTSISDKHPQLTKGVHNSFAEDKLGRIWDATSNGLFIFNPSDSSIYRLTPNEGLSDISASTIVFDASDNAWVGTHDGLNRINPNLDIIPFYGKNDMSDNDYSSATISTDGSHLIFSGDKGLTLLDPDKLNKPMFERDIYISGIYLNGRKVNNTTLTLSGDKVIPDTNSESNSINLSFKDNSLVLRMSTRDFRETDNLIYQWRIPGSVNDWVSTSPGSGTIALPHLQSGNYRLEIRAFESGLYSDVEIMDIHVSSPWYLSTFAKIIYFIILCSFVVLAWKVIKHKNIERINEEKIKFFINVSHEIRSPLTLILSPLERIMKKEHDPDTYKNLKAIQRNANRILGLINQLLDIRKIEKGKMQLNRRETELMAFTNELVDIFKPQAEEKNITLEFENLTPDCEKLNVWIDRNNFDKVLVNLISNAIKYTPEGGNIVVGVNKGNDSDMDDYAEITVTDTGIGLDEKNLNHIFERFYQGKFNNGEVPIGFGIGLDLCRNLVELHNGTITAANRTDCKGSQFTVRIPLLYKHLPTETESESGGVKSERKTPLPTAENKLVSSQSAKKIRNNASLKILVVDDDAEIRAFLADTLSNIGKVSEATNGEEALRKTLDSKPDLIISDVVMPGIDGLTLLKTLKTNVDTNHIPVILLSSKNDVADRMAGWEKGADGYLGKPFSIEELQSMVDNLIHNRLRLRGKFSGTQQQDGKIDTPELKGNDKILIDKIVKEINDHLEDSELNVEKLCQEVGLSRAHLNRKMKELFGLTPSELIRNVRLRKACELLKQPDVDISQIAYSVGFSSQPHFSTAFKKFTGISPTEYRQKNAGQPSN